MASHAVDSSHLAATGTFVIVKHHGKRNEQKSHDQHGAPQKGQLNPGVSPELAGEEQNAAHGQSEADTGANDPRPTACHRALGPRAPFGPWTDGEKPEGEPGVYWRRGRHGADGTTPGPHPTSPIRLSGSVATRRPAVLARDQAEYDHAQRHQDREVQDEDEDPEQNRRLVALHGRIL